MDQIEIEIKEMDALYFDKECASYHPSNNELLEKDIHEYQHFKNVIACFYNYMNDMKVELQRIKTHFETLKPEQRNNLLMNYQDRIKKFDYCIKKNANFCFLIVAAYVDMFPEMDLSQVKFVSELPYFPHAQHGDISKLRITLKQFYRDWSIQGQAERDQSYKPIIDCLQNYYPDAKTRDKKYQVLLPGAGLGRLVFELASRGFAAQGNEFSYFMLLSSHFIINLTQKKNQYELYPFANNFCNRLSESDQFELVQIPDVVPAEVLTENDQMSFVAGEFITVYHQEKYFNFWDSIITCFFIDTANNVLDYIDTIYEILKPKGIWINFGPLEYHFANQFSETSIELSYEDIKHYIKQKGFEISSEQMQESTYNHSKLDQKYLMYNCIFFIAVKK
ncbi:unnamed protein product [Paramecium octaurelia]|uniref:Carnosine N-methyltransferase n=1 Tax=Paramecium octaurelia TaxID=43137 RepID=A0A8S1TPF9_PAROT|nr:unnamed protein product [Paramecium octaurelia]